MRNHLEIYYSLLYRYFSIAKTITYCGSIVHYRSHNKCGIGSQGTRTQEISPERRFGGDCGGTVTKDQGRIQPIRTCCMYCMAKFAARRSVG